MSSTNRGVSSDSSSESDESDSWNDYHITQQEVLYDYIQSLPNDVELVNEYKMVRFKKSQPHTGYHELPVNDLHDLIVEAVNCSDYDGGMFHYRGDAYDFLNRLIKENVWKMLLVNGKQIPDLSDGLSFVQDRVEVIVHLCDSIIKLLQVTVDDDSLIQLIEIGSGERKNFSGHIKMSISSTDKYEADGVSQFNQLSTVLPFHLSSFSCEVSLLQAIIALVVTIRCYPAGWKRYFFWDAWLAVTIQLGLLKKSPKGEVFPCVWMAKVFDAERFIGFPEQVNFLIMGQDPISKDSRSQDINLSTLRSATGIAFHNVDLRSAVRMTTKYGLDCKDDKPIQHCKDGTLMVNMIRCIPRNSQSMASYPFYDAWYVYSLKMAKYFGEHQKPVAVMCNKKCESDLVKHILNVND
ncbi:uncharacterized protein [Dysidea avara]|uniref:uncharacterized protein n=1 Tax=Dysidea avara TaxID=196820 RepID=UPI00332A15A6